MSLRRTSLSAPVLIFLSFIFLIPEGLASSPSAGEAGGPLTAAGPASDDPAPDSRSFDITGGYRGLISPHTQLYPGYIADPMRPASALNLAHFQDSEIPDSGEDRYLLRMGASLGLFRLFPAADPDSGFQLNLEGAFLGMFDRKNSLDNIGWDGLYCLNIAWASGRGLAARFGFVHDSSHVGDEYIERTGRERINYTRQEYILGLSQQLPAGFRIYGEGGYAFDLRNEEIQDHWRVQGGVELEDKKRFFNGRAGYYAAINLTAYQEEDWEPDTTIQTGLVMAVPESSRTYRLGVEYRDGRSVIGEFFQDNETYIAWGFWIDL